MGFFDKTKDKIVNAGSAIGQKASGVSGTVAVTMRIREDEKTLEKTFLEMAKVLYDNHLDEIKVFCPELCKKISNTKKKLAKDRMELAKCKGLQICLNCGAEQGGELVCCSSCGINMSEAAMLLADELELEKLTCSNCGQELDENCSFCPNCGTKVQ